MSLQAANFITKKLQPYLRLLPENCLWAAHILALRRPHMSLHHDQNMMVAYALCKKAARLGCSGITLLLLLLLLRICVRACTCKVCKCILAIVSILYKPVSDEQEISVQQCKLAHHQFLLTPIAPYVQGIGHKLLRAA